MNRAAYLIPFGLMLASAPALADNGNAATTTPLAGATPITSTDGQQMRVMRTKWKLKDTPAKKTKVAVAADPAMQGPAVPKPQRIKLPPKHVHRRAAVDDRPKRVDGTQVISRIARGNSRNNRD